MSAANPSSTDVILAVDQPQGHAAPAPRARTPASRSPISPLHCRSKPPEPPMTSTNVYITVRVSDVSKEHATPESKRARCSGCHAPVWIDPMTYVPAASREGERRLRVLCGPCASAEGLLR